MSKHDEYIVKSDVDEIFPQDHSGVFLSKAEAMDHAKRLSTITKKKGGLGTYRVYRYRCILSDVLIAEFKNGKAIHFCECGRFVSVAGKSNG